MFFARESAARSNTAAESLKKEMDPSTRCFVIRTVPGVAARHGNLPLKSSLCETMRFRSKKGHSPHLFPNLTATLRPVSFLVASSSTVTISVFRVLASR